jgi:hypothetical protein
MSLRTMTDRSLLIYFNKYNRKYFGNRLKLVYVRFVSNRHKLMRGCMGRTFMFDQIGANGNIIKSYASAKIFINARYRRDPRVTLPTLLHEMNHMAHPQVKDCKKSPTFEKGMRRLAARGAMERLW